jgi:trigger factor
MVGVTVGETREFELTVPDDKEVYDEDIVGRQVAFEVTAKKIETVTLPALNDEFAARMTEDEDEPLSLLQLRLRVRENLQQELERRSKNDYSQSVLDAIVEQATIAYPEEMVSDQANGMLDELDNRMRQQGINLDTYMRVTGKSREDLIEEYHEPAVEQLKRQLTMLEIVHAENLQVGADQIEQRIEEMLESFGEQAASMRSLFDRPEVRMNVANELLNERILDVVTAIGQGKDLTPAVDSEVVSPASDIDDNATPEAGDEDEPVEPDAEGE